MSEFSGDSQGPRGGPLGRGRRTAASVMLREGDAGAQDERSMLDPAAKSLADALRITYRLLQAAMVVLIGLFFASGVKSVGTSESAARVTLGRIVATKLAPGFEWSWPEPIGEVVSVDTGVKPMALKAEFFPHLSTQELESVAKSGPQALANGIGGETLDPATDGELITADGAIAHARCQVSYARTEVERYARAIEKSADDSVESRIVGAAVRRGVVQAAASVTLDEFIKDQPDDPSETTYKPIARRAQEVAQAALDAIDAGIVIQQLAIIDRIPPRRVMGEYNRVQSAQATATQDVEKARAEANATLLETAGTASGVLLAQIDKYEQELAGKDSSEAGATLGRINSILMNEDVEIDGKAVKPGVSGKVTTILDEARQYATGAVGQAKTDAGVFAAKREAFLKNPLVMLNADWSAAYTEFQKKVTVQSILLPPGSARMVLTINRDPQIAKEMEEAANTKEFLRGQEERERKRRRAIYEDKLDAANKVQER